MTAGELLAGRLLGRYRHRLTHRLPGPVDIVHCMLDGGWTPKDVSDKRRIPICHEGLPEPDAGRSVVTWVGHSTFLLQLGGVTVLTDPVWGEVPGVKRRLTPPGIAWEDLPRVDVVVISHDHVDHMDRRTLRRLSRETAMVVPLGVGRWLRRTGFRDVRELDWWESTEVGEVQIGCVPAHHWSGRGPFTLCATLWAGWILTTARERIYFAGDTAYGNAFKQIGARYPGIDVALVPTGSYEPRWLQQSAHVDPGEAVQICQDVGARVLVPMHWGTFLLGREAILAPATETARAWAAAGKDACDLWLLAIGESRMLDPSAPLHERRGLGTEPLSDHEPFPHLLRQSPS